MIQATRADVKSAKRRVYWRTSGFITLMYVGLPAMVMIAKTDEFRIAVMAGIGLVGFIQFRLGKQVNQIASDLTLIAHAGGAANIEFVIQRGLTSEIFFKEEFAMAFCERLKREAERLALPERVRSQLIRLFEPPIEKAESKEGVEEGLEQLREIERMLPPNHSVRKAYAAHYFHRDRIEAIMAAPQPSTLLAAEVSKETSVYALRIFALDETQAAEDRLAAHARSFDLEGKSEAYDFIETEFRRSRINRQYAWRYFWKSA